MGLGRIETGWGLYLFTLCVAASFAISMLDARRSARPSST
jgi:hypothetical protein